MGIVTSIHENIKSNPLKKITVCYDSIRSCFHFVADSHNPYKFLLSSYKGIKQAVRHQLMVVRGCKFLWINDMISPHRTFYEIWHHLVVYQHYIAGQRYETAFPKVTG